MTDNTLPTTPAEVEIEEIIPTEEIITDNGTETESEEVIEEITDEDETEIEEDDEVEPSEL